MDVRQYIIILIYLIKTSDGYTPSGYLGCYEDYPFPHRVLNGVKYTSDKNSGDKCKSSCKGFRYAGTENGDECFCGHNIRYEDQRSGCEHSCPGNQNEKCGGSWQISIYDTWPCASLMPCKNHATCVDIDADKYMCTCSGDWTGTHCDEVKTTPMTTTTTTTLATTKSTSGQTIDITTSLSTSSKEAVNGTDFPETVEDDDENLLIVLYVLLPFAVIVTVIVLAIVLRRRRLKNQVQVLYKAQGSLPNIYANLASINNTPLVNLQIHADNAIKRENIKVEAKVKDIDTTEEMEFHDHIYVNMPVENTDEYMHSYDHISTLKKSAVNKTYSKLSETQLGNKLALNTNYSHIEERYDEHGVLDGSLDDDVTYNRLDMEGIPKDGPLNVVCDAESDYDHAAGGHGGINESLDGDVTYNRLDMKHIPEDGLRNVACNSENDYDHTDGGHVLPHSNITIDDYSHLDHREFSFQIAQNVNNTPHCHSFDKAEHADEEEYACVSKSPKTRT